MKKKVISAAFVLMMLMLAACANPPAAGNTAGKTGTNEVLEAAETAVPRPAEKSSGEDGETMDRSRIQVRIGSQSFTVTLYKNEAAAAFAEMLPITLDMSELNGNEKYVYLDCDLPTLSEPVGTIQNGDFMLFGSNCLVLFYDSFSTGYSYTRLGRAEQPEALCAALGRGGVSVAFSHLP